MNTPSGHSSQTVTQLTDSDPAIEGVGVVGAEVVDKRSIDVAGEDFGLKESYIGDVSDEEVGRLTSLGAL